MNIPEIKSLCERIFASYFSKTETEGTIHKVCFFPVLRNTIKKTSTYPSVHSQYKIDLRVRNHNTISRPVLIQAVASCVPAGHIVDLVDPDVHILVEVFKVRDDVFVVYRIKSIDLRGVE